MENGKWAVYLLIEDFDIVYIGITTNISRRRSQHNSIAKIKFDYLKVIIHGLDKETAEIIESCLIHFGAVDMGLRLKNRNHNPMFNVIRPFEKQQFEPEING